MVEKHWIQTAIEHHGALHRELGVPSGEKIPVERLHEAAAKPGLLGKRARLALTLHHLQEHDAQPKTPLHRAMMD